MTTAQDRIDALELAFGSLDDPGNPLGAAALLAADAAGTVLPEAERVLDDFGLNAEFVPADVGGRLERMDLLGGSCARCSAGTPPSDSATD